MTCKELSLKLKGDLCCFTLFTAIYTNGHFFRYTSFAFSAGTKGPKVFQENPPTPLHHQQLMHGRMEPCFYAVYVKFSPCSPKAAAEIGSTAQATLTVASACSCKLTGVDLAVVPCCCSLTCCAFRGVLL